MGFREGSGISWTIRKQSAPCSRQITITTPHQSIFTDWMLFLMSNQHFQSTEGKYSIYKMDGYFSFEQAMNKVPVSKNSHNKSNTTLPQDSIGK